VSGGSGQFLTLDRDGGATSAAINLGGLFSGLLSGADEPEAGRVLAGIDPRTALLTPARATARRSSSAIRSIPCRGQSGTSHACPVPRCSPIQGPTHRMSGSCAC
jgi:hypothetical protein